MTYNLQRREAMYKWREKNKERYNAYVASKMLNYYTQNKTYCNQQKVKRVRYKRECERLRNMLIE
jgi:formylglycine-generating enzyme required for sulfatase activity